MKHKNYYLYYYQELNEKQNNYWILLSHDINNYADLGGCYPP